MFCWLFFFTDAKVLSISPPTSKPIITKELSGEGDQRELSERSFLEKEQEGLPLPAITGTRRPGIAVRRSAEGWKPSVRAFEPPQRKGLEHKFQDILDAEQPDLGEFIISIIIIIIMIIIDEN